MLSDRLRAYLAQQLGYPSGWFGRGLIRLLNRENAGMNQLALEMMGLQAGEHVLEIGFGGGYLIQQILADGLSVHVYGVDYSQDVLKAGQRKFRRAIQQDQLTLQQASVEALPFEDGTFGAIATVNTIYFWPDIALGLAECRRVLKPSGRLIIGYNSPEFLEQQQLTQHGFKAYSVDQLEAFLQGAGFTHFQTQAGHDSRNSSFFCSRGVSSC